MATKKQSEKDTALADFEKSVTELEALVEKLETGDTGLEVSLKQFERGVQLARECQQVLKNAELRVEQLLERNGETSIAEFNE